MIKELTQFIKEIPAFVKEKALEPKAGLHIKVSVDSQLKVIGHERYHDKKNGELSDFLRQCAQLQEYSWMIDTNKCFDLPAKGIHSASPYCLAFKIKLSKEDEENKQRANELKKEKPTKEYKQEIIKDILATRRLKTYFEKCFEPKYGLDENTKRQVNKFKDLLNSEIQDHLEGIEQYDDLDWGDYILIYQNEPLKKYQDFQIVYLSDGLFNTAEFNVDIDNIRFGTSNFYNGFNSKKPFLTHQTASFDITGRISASEAKELSEFALLTGKKLFPNPLPIFIDNRELTNYAVVIFQREENKKITHREIIIELLKKHQTLGNYYLLYFSGGAIQDFDFVAKFEYELKAEGKGWTIENITEIVAKEQILPAERVLNVFDFERIVVRELFNNTLVKVDEKKNEVSVRYFDKMDPKYYRPALYTLLLKYRKPIYDYVYKSMRSSIQGHQVYDICMTMIIDELKQGGKDFSIKRKLNIYFSLYQYFEKNKNYSIMPSKIEEHKTQLRLVADNEDTHFNTDETYAFGAGQLIYYLLSQSEAGERTHALLEPFLQKTNYAHFNDAISNIILKYKHALSFDYKRFNKLAGEVLDYKAERDLVELRPTILAGYFCPNIFYASTKK